MITFSLCKYPRYFGIDKTISFGKSMEIINASKLLKVLIIKGAVI
jgi:hypothetical protein